MSDHTPAQLARILAPLWKAVPEARPKYGERELVCEDDHGCWLEIKRRESTPIDDDVARDLILARLQLAIEKRCRRLQFNPSGSIDAMWGQGDGTRYGHASHPDPLIARAMLLAQIVGVELGDADA